MFGIGFDTPSVKDLERYSNLLKKEDIEIYHLLMNQKTNNDYIKIIVNSNGEVIGLLNKITKHNYIFKQHKNNEIIDKVAKNIKFLK